MESYRLDSLMYTEESRYRFIRISRDLQRYAHEIIAPICAQHDLTMQQMYVLKELQVCPVQSISALSDRVGILHANFPSVCRKLENRGLIERKRNEIDRRSSLLQLTPAGKDMLELVDKEIAVSLDDQIDAGIKEAFEKINEGLESLEEIVKKKTTNQRGADSVR